MGWLGQLAAKGFGKPAFFLQIGGLGPALCRSLPCAFSCRGHVGIVLDVQDRQTFCL